MTVYDEIQAERERQDAKWGEQDHPSVCPVLVLRHDARRMCEEYGVPTEWRAKWLCDAHTRRDSLQWPHITTEEHSEAIEAFARGEDEKGREELVQLAAVVVAWIECIDRRKARDG